MIACCAQSVRIMLFSVVCPDCLLRTKWQNNAFLIGVSWLLSVYKASQLFEHQKCAHTVKGLLAVGHNTSASRTFPYPKGLLAVYKASESFEHQKCVFTLKGLLAVHKVSKYLSIRDVHIPWKIWRECERAHLIVSFQFSAVAFELSVRDTPCCQPSIFRLCLELQEWSSQPLVFRHCLSQKNREVKTCNFLPWRDILK